MSTQTQVRAAFWLEVMGSDGKLKRFRGKGQNELPADVRMDFCDFVDTLQRTGQISERLAERLCRSYGILGLCDPAYIANVIAVELGLGDGLGKFEEKTHD